MLPWVRFLAVLSKGYGGNRGLWVAGGEELGRRRLPAAVQRSPGAAEQSEGGRGRRLGFAVAADGRMREGTGVPIYRAAANLGVRARVGKPARTTARIGPVVARVGRKELTGLARFVGDG